MTTRFPKRILFNSASAYGHVHPLVPLARALQSAGHEVAFAGTPLLRPKAEGAGFPFLRVDSNRAEDPEYRQVKQKLASMPTTLASEIYAYPRLFGGISARLTMPSLVDVAQAWRPDMFVREAGSYTSAIAAEYMGVPHMTVAFAAALRGMAIFEGELAEQLDPVRRAWGLPPDPDLKALYRYPVLAYTPPGFSLQEVGGEWRSAGFPYTPHYFRANFFDAPAGEMLPAWIEQLPDQPTVYLTLGTEVNKDPELYPSVMQMLIAGLRYIPINLIVTLGRDKDPSDFGLQPSNVHIESYIPQSLLLPRCDVIVMHGGTNTLLQALDAGLPMVIVPLIADQFFNATVAQNLELARVVQMNRLTPDSIRVAVQEVLGNAVYRQNVARLQAEMHSLPGIEHAVVLVEEVLKTKDRPSRL